MICIKMVFSISDKIHLRPNLFNYKHIWPRAQPATKHQPTSYGISQKSYFSARKSLVYKKKKKKYYINNIYILFPTDTNSLFDFNQWKNIWFINSFQNHYDLNSMVLIPRFKLVSPPPWCGSRGTRKQLCASTELCSAPHSTTCFCNTKYNSTGCESLFCLFLLYFWFSSGHEWNIVLSLSSIM